MKLIVERKPGSLAQLNITADEDEVNKAVDQAITKQARTMQVPGFRKGKAPKRMVEKMFGRDMFLQEAADEIMNNLYGKALEQEDLRPVGEPEVEVLSLEPVNYVVTVPIYPAIEIGDYTSVRVDPVDAAVTDEDVQEVLTRLQRQQAPWVDLPEARKPTDGDQITLDYAVKEGDNDFQEPVTDAVWVIGETNLLPQLKDKLEDMNLGESDEFEMVFEEDDETADPMIRGKSLTYSITLKDIKQRDIKEIDDEFARDVAGAESVDDLMQQIREDVHQGKTGDARNQVMNTIVDAILEQAEIDLPEAMIDEEVEHQINHRKEDLQKQNISWEDFIRSSGLTEDEIKEDTKPEAARRVRTSMILQEIARLEKVDVTDEDLDNEINRVAGVDLDPDTDDEEAKQRAQRLREIYNSEYFRNVLRNDMYEKKLTERIIEIATGGKGAVTNGWVAPDPADVVQAVNSTTSGSTDDVAAAGAETTPESSDDEAATGAEPTPKSGDDNAPSPSTRSSKLPGEGEGTDWVAGDGTQDVPEGFPLKGNASSRIYHPEESSSYNKVIAEIYFATPEAAEAAGYRLPKSLQPSGESDDE